MIRYSNERGPGDSHKILCNNFSLGSLEIEELFTFAFYLRYVGDPHGIILNKICEAIWRQFIKETMALWIICFELTRLYPVIIKPWIRPLQYTWQLAKFSVKSLHHVILDFYIMCQGKRFYIICVFQGCFTPSLIMYKCKR